MTPMIADHFVADAPHAGLFAVSTAEAGLAIRLDGGLMVALHATRSAPQIVADELCCPAVMAHLRQSHARVMVGLHRMTGLHLLLPVDPSPLAPSARDTLERARLLRDTTLHMLDPQGLWLRASDAATCTALAAAYPDSAHAHEWALTSSLAPWPDVLSTAEQQGTPGLMVADFGPHTPLAHTALLQRTATPGSPVPAALAQYAPFRAQPHTDHLGTPAH
ncbi:hypothetical protein [Deinococcus maricopensis]|uniref:Uncharacterized protein n=1 Tax=Deinococcus maricopensis (strain DSM 21211 / LMG 22137 / NRRL B-23946 / LB-34) TaxID=709986 RepID=E8U955_DEIML|nr:hypothetical protein [Deinococcus maricopensis]ADV67594.1 hypothetical protein Deima_1949 [Deinococcus maricopensis DSM 21211]